jgi:putative ABC transport system permease protein
MLKTYLHFESSSDASAFEDRLAALVARRAVLELGADAKEQIRLDLVPLRSVHLVERKDKLAVLAVGLIAAMTLLVACINFVNLATARAVLRAREVAIRKVVGASRRSLILQFLAESLFTTIIAAVIGLTFAELLLPPLNDLLGWTLEISYFGPDGILPALVLMVLLIAVASGFYPALVLSRFAPSQVLASARTAGGGRRSALTRELLVALQFAVAVTFMIATAVIFSQTRFVGAADLGFDRSNLLLLPSFRHEQLEPARRAHFLDQAARLPGVVAVTQSDAAPGDDSFSSSAGVGRAGMVGDRPTLARTTIGDGFFQTFGVRLAAGRALGPTFGRDDQSRTSEAPGGQRHDNVLLNRAALEALGFTSPEAALGQTVEVDVESGREPATIVGVVEDIRFRSLRGPVSPTIFYYQSRDLIFPMAAIRYANMTEGEARAAVQRLWRRVAPDVPFEAISAEQNLSAYYLEDSRRSQLFLLGAAAAIFISCLGLYALASFNAARRTKEIGIRKALGAKRRDLLLLLTSQMLRPVAIAVFVAWPVAFYTMRNWLNGFEHRIELSAIYFVIAGLIALGIAAGTIAVQVLKVASVPPARALRHD